ncbi:hypothetical protein ACIGEZ_24000 [Streptomyces sp. NPDC085481]|uniref:hypothetical protein n=1 Tax=Streptomyces sp. NPDC085481 TaxID=3365727 RepID=UPI0037D5D7C2
MTEPHDPLRSLFQEAAAAGRSRATHPPVADISERGRRAQRRRLAVFAAGACLVLGGGSTALATLLPGGSQPVLPATSPSVGGPSPMNTTRPPKTDVPFPGVRTSPPIGATTSPPTGEHGSAPPQGTPTSTRSTDR